MAATVQINFRVGGADTAARMVGSLSQQVEQVAKEQYRASQRAAEANLKSQLRIKEAAAKADLNVSQERAKQQIKVHADTVRAQNAVIVAGQRASIAARSDGARRELAIHTSAERAKAAATVASLRVQSRAEAHEAARQQRGENRVGTTVRSAFSGIAAPALHGAVEGGKAVLRGGRAIAEGAGMEFSPGALVKRMVDRDTQARQISNSAYVPEAQGGTGAQTVRQDPKAILAQTEKVAIDSATDQSSILAGIAEYTKLTGKLEDAKSIMDDNARLAKATGASFEDVMRSSAHIATALGDTVDAETKKNVTGSVLRQLAGQGKLGQVELSDEAKELAKVGAASGKYAGPRDAVLGEMGALLQTSMGAKGGSTTATQASTAVGALARDLPKKATQKGLDALGVNVWADPGHQQLKMPSEIIGDLFDKTHGDQKKLSKALPNSMSMRAVQGFMTIGADAERQKKGTGRAAIAAEFKKYNKVAMTKEEIDASFGEIDKGPAAQAQRAQTKMEGKVKGAAEMVAEHPIAAGSAVIMAMIGKSIAAAKIASMSVTAGVVTVTGGGGGGGTPPPPGGGPGMPPGAGGGVVGPAAAGAAIIGVGAIAGLDTAKEGDDALMGQSLRSGNLATKIRRDGGTPEERAYAQKQIESMESQTGATGVVGRYIEGTLAGGKNIFSGKTWDKAKHGDVLGAAGDVASTLPMVAPIRGAVTAVAGGKTADSANAAIAELKAALDKPTQLAPGTMISVAISNWGDMPKPPATPQGPISGQ